MKKIKLLLIGLMLVVFINNCAGYKPIFGTGNLQFKILQYSLEGEKKLGNKIYSKLYNLTKSIGDEDVKKNIHITINSKKNKNSTSKDSTGKSLAYRIEIITKIIVKDYFGEQIISNKNFIVSESYKVQDQYSETINSENRTIENLINRTYEEILIELSEKI